MRRKVTGEGREKACRSDTEAALARHATLGNHVFDVRSRCTPAVVTEARSRPRVLSNDSDLVKHGTAEDISLSW
jgi:hypothetical protein